MNTRAQASDSIGFLVVDTVRGGFAVLLGVLSNCHWCCEIRHSDGMLSYRTLDEIRLIPQIVALRPLPLAHVA